MLKLVAHSGDACHLISDPATLEHKFAVPKQHYKAVGRDDLRGAQRGNRKADMVRIMSIMRWRENNDAENTARAEHEASGQNNDARSLQSHRCVWWVFFPPDTDVPPSSYREETQEHREYLPGIPGRAVIRVKHTWHPPIVGQKPSVED
jgi:hypothetical protein